MAFGAGSDWAEPDGDGAPAAPVESAQRLIALDFIRGIAVLGILVANIVAFGHVELAYSWPGAMPEPLDAGGKAAWLAQYLLVDGKMRGLFTLLFGAGMGLFMDRAWARGDDAELQVRRLFWLMLFGLAHFFLLFWGDILFLYAISGFVLLLMVEWEAPRLLRVGLVWYLAGALFLAAMVGWQALVEQSGPGASSYASLVAGWEARMGEAAAEYSAFTQGSYGAEISFVAGHKLGLLAQYPFFALWETIPLMLIGMGLYRAGLFSGALDPAAMRRWGWAGTLAGLALTIPLGIWVIVENFPPYLTQFVFAAASALPRLAMTLGLAALLASWAPRAAGGWLGARLVAAGRMAFSNYLGTSLVMMLVFRHWAGGLFGTLDRVELWGAILFGWALMLGWSKPWLARFRYGPLEWLWRCLTYWRLFPLRR